MPNPACLRSMKTNSLPPRREPAFALATLAALAFFLTLPTRADGAADAHRLDWWRAARFGLFVHWGPVSLRGTEIGWSRGDQVPVAEYDQLYRQFNPTQFRADEWVAVAKAAGMKYLVLTSKHHDGFCLWHTRATDYHIRNTPFGRDVIAELARACRRQGLVFCLYHSICDWHHPDYPLGSPGGKTPKAAPNMEAYHQYLKNQLAELVRGYGPLGILWFDGEWEKPWTQERGADLYRYVRQLQPSIIINNRVNKGRVGMEGVTQLAGPEAGDYDTPEQQIGRFNDQRPWETCMTLCEQWAWKPNDRLKPLAECLQALVRCAGGDGNLLLNVGPMPDGRIEPRQVERLQEVGRWLRRYGASIYGTRGGPFKPGPWGASTHRGKTIYLHVFNWNGDTLALPVLARRVVSAKVLTGGSARVLTADDRLSVHVAPESQDRIDTVVALKLDGPAEGMPPVDVAAAAETKRKDPRTP
jgi:alpha-L-fucosidase